MPLRGGDGASMEPAKFPLCSVLLTFQRINVLVTNEDTRGTDPLMRPQARKPPPEVKSGGRTNSASSRCVVMRHRQQKSVGPMSNQRAHDFAICSTLPLMPTALRPSEGPTSPKRATREDAVRIAKAKISRRRSLKMQREAQKAQNA
jgi:hypothetical protein